MMIAGKFKRSVLKITILIVVFVGLIQNGSIRAEGKVETKENKVNHHVESIIQFTGGVIGPAYFASLFTLKGQKSGVMIIPGDDGSLLVQAGQTSFEFELDRGHLKLARIAKL